MAISPKIVLPNPVKKPRFNPKIAPKIAVAAGAVILLLLGLLLLAQGRVDTQDYQRQVRQILKERTGKDVIIKGKIAVALVPLPTLYIPSVELRDTNSDVPSPSLTISEIDVRASFFSVLTGKPQVSAITLETPVLEIERAENGVINWDWLNTALLHNPEPGSNGAGAAAISLAIENGQILYHNRVNSKDLLIQGLSLSAYTGAHPGLNGSFSVNGQLLHITANTTGSASANGLPEGALPLNVKLFSDAKNMMQLQGGIAFGGGTPQISGTLSADIEDVLAWSTVKAQDANRAFSPLTGQPINSKLENGKLPLTFKGELKQNGLQADISNIEFNGLNSTGKGSLLLAWDQKIPQIRLAMQFTTFDYDHARLFAGRIIDQVLTAPKTGDVYETSNAAQENLLPKNLQVDVNLSADHLLVGAQSWEKANVTAKLADQVITVEQFNIQLPGESSLALFGIISQATTSSDLRFEGSMETEGKSLRQLLTVFDESAVNLPETGFRSFYARSNIFVSSEQVRLSEADVKIDELRLNGGLVAYLDSNPRLEADVHLKDISFDYFRDVWRANQQAQKIAGQGAVPNESAKQDTFIRFDKSVNFDWLKNLQTSIDFRINVDHFTFLDRKGDSASFRIFARAGEFGLYDVKLYYPTETLEANLAFDVKGEQPFVNVLFSAGEFNADYFSADAQPAVPASPAAPAPVEKTLPDGNKLKITPQAQHIDVPAAPATTPGITPGITQAPAVPVTSVDPRKRWSDNLIDMSWLDGFNGDFDISLGALTIGDKRLENLKFKGKLDHNALSFKDMTFLYWQGKCDVSGSVYGGRVPGMAIGFTIYNAELHDMINYLIGRDNVSGRVSVSGTLATSGTSARSWVEQSEAKLVMAARGVRVQGINLQGVIDAVGVARTAADVFNNVNLSLVNGSTLFSVDGNINVKNGVIRTPGIALKSGTTLGNMRGEINLLQWTISLATLFQFPVLSSETIPTLPVQLYGSIDNPELRTDTASLEAYISARITGK